MGAEAVRRPQEDRPESRQQLSCGQSEKGGNRKCNQFARIHATKCACTQATVEKVLKSLSEDKKDVRKGDWTNKEVSSARFPFHPLPCTIVALMTKSSRLDQTQLVEAGVTPQHAFEITFLLNTPRFLHFFIRLSGRLDG